MDDNIHQSTWVHKYLKIKHTKRKTIFSTMITLQFPTGVLSQQHNSPHNLTIQFTVIGISLHFIQFLQSLIKFRFCSLILLLCLFQIIYEKGKSLEIIEIKKYVTFCGKDIHSTKIFDGSVFHCITPLLAKILS